jgi:hypothetical protein
MGDHSAVPGTGGAVQGRIAVLVPGVEEEVSGLAMNHGRALEELLAVSPRGNHVEEGVPLSGWRYCGRRWHDPNIDAVGDNLLDLDGNDVLMRCPKLRISFAADKEMLKPQPVAAPGGHEQLGIMRLVAMHLQAAGIRSLLCVTVLWSHILGDSGTSYLVVRACIFLIEEHV